MNDILRTYPRIAQHPLCTAHAALALITDQASALAFSIPKSWPILSSRIEHASCWMIKSDDFIGFADFVDGMSCPEVRVL